MKITTFLLTLLLGLWWVNLSQATLRYVSQTGSGSYSTVTTAYNASATGDTILIGPGNYSSEFRINVARRLVWLGAGWDLSTCNRLNFYTTAGNGSVVEGLSFSDINAMIEISTGTDSITVRRCQFGSTGYGIYAAGAGKVYAEDCAFVSSGGGGCVQVPTAQAVFRNCVFAFTIASSNYLFSGNNGSLEIYNSVIVGWSRIFNLSGTSPVIFINNIIYDWGASPFWGTYPFGSVFDYNASITVAAPGTNALLLTANPFVNYDVGANYISGTSNLRLVGGSVCIDAGHPGLLDADSSRSDLGVYGGALPFVENGVPTYPWVTSLQLSNTLVGIGDSVTTTINGRIGPQY